MQAIPIIGDTPRKRRRLAWITSITAGIIMLFGPWLGVTLETEVNLQIITITLKTILGTFLIIGALWIKDRNDGI